MRPDPLRVLVVAVAIALATGCAGSPSRSVDAQASGTQAAMSNKGLANLRLAQNYLSAGRLEYALDRANRALRTDPNSADLQIVLGMIREKTGDKPRAGEHYERAVKLGPDSGHVLNVYAAWLCQQGRADDADLAFQRALKDPFYKTREQAYYNAGKCAMEAGQLERAAQYLRQGLASTPEDARLLARMAELQYQRKDYMSARAFYQRHEALGVDSPEMLRLAANIEQGAGNAAAAERYQQKLRAKFPDADKQPATEAPRQP